MEISEKAKEMFVKLSEIQPAVSVAGMEEEAAVIGQIKRDLREMMGSISPQSSVAESVLAASFEDLMNCAKELKQLLFQLELSIWVTRSRNLDGEQADRMINIARLAAETFAIRANDYLGSKISLQTLFKEA